MTNPTEPATSKLDQLVERLEGIANGEIWALQTPISVTARQAADEIQIVRAERSYWRDRAQSAEASLAEMQADHAENFGGKVVMSIEAFTELQDDAGGERLRAALELARDRMQVAFETVSDADVVDQFVRNTLRNGVKEASLALSGGTEKQGLRSSSASRAAQGTDSLAAPEAEPSAPRSYGASVNGGE